MENFDSAMNAPSNKKQSLILMITVGIVFFLVGVGAGFFLGPKIGPQKVKIEAANNLSSKVISSMVAYGEVKNISGKNITLGNLGDSLAISVAGSAPVYSFVNSAGTASPVQEKVKFEDIKIGDKVNVAVKTLPSGQLQGLSVIILP